MGAEIEVDVLLRQLAQGDAVTARLPSPSSSLFDTVEERELLLVGANNKPHYWAGLED